MKIIITKQGKKILEILGYELTYSIDRILKCLPAHDVFGIEKLIITDSSKNRKNALALYVPQYKNEGPSIELYLKNLFSHIKSAENFKFMVPIQEIGLAHALFHEIGHHVRATKHHGIKRERSEKHAMKYAKMKLDNYILNNSESIDACFNYLFDVAKERNLDVDILNSMRNNWSAQYEMARKCLRLSRTKLT